jgi:hypothetical protein
LTFAKLLKAITFGEFNNLPISSLNVVASLDILMSTELADSQLISL